MTTEQYTKTKIRGVPAAIFDGGRRSEVYTAKTTLVVFAENTGLARSAANRLVGVHAGRVVHETNELPAPVEGAMEDKLAC